MELSRYRITIYKRDDVYYARFFDRTLHKNIADRSVNILAKSLEYNTSRKLNKTVAMAIAIKALDEGIVGNETGNISFIQYLTNFWSWEKSE